MPRSPYEPDAPTSLWPFVWLLVVPVVLAYGFWRLFTLWLLQQHWFLPD